MIAHFLASSVSDLTASAAALSVHCNLVAVPKIFRRYFCLVLFLRDNVSPLRASTAFFRLLDTCICSFPYSIFTISALDADVSFSLSSGTSLNFLSFLEKTGHFAYSCLFRVKMVMSVMTDLSPNNHARFLFRRLLVRSLPKTIYLCLQTFETWQRVPCDFFNTLIEKSYPFGYF